MADMKITDGKGVHFTMDNGVLISIQIGPGNYGSNYDMGFSEFYEGGRKALPSSTTAEIAVWNTRPVSGMLNLGDDTVRGYVPVEDVLRFMEFLRKLPEGVTTNSWAERLAEFDWEPATQRDEAAE